MKGYVLLNVVDGDDIDDDYGDNDDNDGDDDDDEISSENYEIFCVCYPNHPRS